MKLIVAVGLRLKQLIDSREDLTIYELAKRAGMPRATLWKIIHPDLTRVKTLKLDTLYQLVDTLEMSLKDFFDDPIFDEVTD